ncbi:glycosyltransferase [Candidatus Wolfebacteria bacterium]|nr:glycosyltransferase [Candidatus Wolfebacteria bacterium]
MKILRVTSSYFPAYRYGGPIKIDYELDKWLVKKGVEVTEYTTNIDGPRDLNVPTNQPINIDGITVIYFKSSFPRAWFYSRYLHKALAKHTKDFDLIHITSVFLSVSTLGAYYAKKFNKPYIISPLGSLMEILLKKKSPMKKKIYISLIEKRNLRDAAAIHFNVEAEKDEYSKLGFPLKRAIILPNGLDPSDFSSRVEPGSFRKKFNIAKDQHVILFLSRLDWKKGLDTLIPAFNKVAEQQPKAILVLAGGDDEGYKKEIEKLIDKYNLKEKVIFTGMIVGDDKTGAFQDSDVFVLPSYSDTFGMVVLEAMYFGLPVVITENVGIAPAIARASAGLVIKKDINELAEAILKILKNPDLAKKMGEAGRQLVRKEFSWSQIAEKFIKEYDNLITNTSIPR